MANQNDSIINPNLAIGPAAGRNLNREFVERDFILDVATPLPATQPKIGRGGFAIPDVTFNHNFVNAFVNDLQPLPTRNEPRVVSQSIAPKTKVTPNTTVDITMTPRSVIPFDVFDVVHPALLGKPIDIVDSILHDATARQTLLRYDNPNDVPAAERTNLINQLQVAANVTVNDANANTSFSTAFQSLRSALAFD